MAQPPRKPNGRSTHRGGKLDNKNPGKRASPPQPVLIKGQGQSPVTNIQPIYDLLACGSVGRAQYSWCAINTGPIPIPPNFCCAPISDAGVRPLNVGDQIGARQFLFSPTGHTVGQQNKVYQFGLFTVDLGILVAPLDLIWLNPTTGNLGLRDPDHTIAIMRVIANTTGTEFTCWFDQEIDTEAHQFMKGWFTPADPFGGDLCRFPVQDGTTNYNRGDYVVCLVSGTFNFATGQPDPAGTLVAAGSRIIYDDVSATWIVQGVENLMRGWFDPNAADGTTPTNPFPIINGSANFQPHQYLVAEDAGNYDFVAGAPAAPPLGEILQLGDRIKYSATQVWEIVGQPLDANKGWFNASVNDGGNGVPYQVIDGSVLYQGGDYAICIVQGFYDFALAVGSPTALGTPDEEEVRQGDRITYDGTNWVVIKASLGLHKGWADTTSAGGGGLVEFPVVNGGVDYLPREFVQFINTGLYDFASGNAGVGTAVDAGDIWRYNGLTFEKDVINQGTSKGFFDPAIDNGGAAVPWDIVDGTIEYEEDEYVIATGDGLYDFTTGLAGTGTTVVTADVIRFTGGVWTVVRTSTTVETVSTVINQPLHGFLPLQHIWYDTGLGEWVLAQADAELTLKHGTVGQVIDTDNFTFVTYGEINYTAHGLNLGATYYLSDSLAGASTDVRPATGFSQVVFEVIDADSVKVIDQAVQRGQVVNVPVGTDIYAVDVIHDGSDNAIATSNNVEGAVQQLDAYLEDALDRQPIATGSLSGALIDFVLSVPAPGTWVPVTDPAMVIGIFNQQVDVDLVTGYMTINFDNPTGGVLAGAGTCVINIQETSGGTDEVRLAFEVNGTVAPNSIMRWNQSGSNDDIIATIAENITGLNQGDQIRVVATTLGNGDLAVSSFQYGFTVYDLTGIASSVSLDGAVIPEHNATFDYVTNEAVTNSGFLQRANQDIAVPEPYDPTKFDPIAAHAIAPDFSASASYPVHQLAMEGGNLYRSIVPIVPAPFDPLQWELAGGSSGGGGSIPNQLGVLINDGHNFTVALTTGVWEFDASELPNAPVKVDFNLSMLATQNVHMVQLVPTGAGVLQGAETSLSFTSTSANRNTSTSGSIIIQTGSSGTCTINVIVNNGAMSFRNTTSGQSRCTIQEVSF